MISLLKVEYINDKLKGDLGTIVIKSYNNNDNNKIYLSQNISDFVFSFDGSKLSGDIYGYALDEKNVKLSYIKISNHFFFLKESSKFNIGTIILELHDNFNHFAIFRCDISIYFNSFPLLEVRVRVESPRLINFECRGISIFNEGLVLQTWFSPKYSVIDCIDEKSKYEIQIDPFYYGKIYYDKLSSVFRKNRFWFDDGSKKLNIAIIDIDECRLECRFNLPEDMSVVHIKRICQVGSFYYIISGKINIPIHKVKGVPIKNTKISLHHSDNLEYICESKPKIIYHGNIMTLLDDVEIIYKECEDIINNDHKLNDITDLIKDYMYDHYYPCVPGECCPGYIKYPINELDYLHLNLLNIFTRISIANVLTNIIYNYSIHCTIYE